MTRDKNKKANRETQVPPGTCRNLNQLVKPSQTCTLDNEFFPFSSCFLFPPPQTIMLLFICVVVSILSDIVLVYQDFGEMWVGDWGPPFGGVCVQIEVTREWSVAGRVLWHFPGTVGKAGSLSSQWEVAGIPWGDPTPAGAVLPPTPNKNHHPTEVIFSFWAEY